MKISIFEHITYFVYIQHLCAPLSPQNEADDSVILCIIYSDYFKVNFSHMLGYDYTEL
jgi:hypothetical protein